MSPRLITALSFSLVLHSMIWMNVFSDRFRSLPSPREDRFKRALVIDPGLAQTLRPAEKKPQPQPQPLPLKPPTKAAKQAPMPSAAAPPAQQKKAAPQKATTEPSRSSSPKPPSAPEAAGQKTGSDLMANPKTRTQFADYFGILKARIQEKLLEKCRGRHLSRGSVELAFVLTSDGLLGHVSVMGGQVPPEPLLRQLAVQAIKDASPFKPFPAEFNARQIAFNLTVHFDGSQL